MAVPRDYFDDQLDAVFSSGPAPKRDAFDHQLDGLIRSGQLKPPGAPKAPEPGFLTRLGNTPGAVLKPFVEGLDPTALKAHVAGTLEAGTPAAEFDWKDKARAADQGRVAAYLGTPEAKEPTLLGTRGELYQAIQPNAAQNLLQLGGMVAGGLARGGIPGAVLGGAATLGPMFLESKTHAAEGFTQGENQKRAAQGLPPMSRQETQAFEQSIQPEATRHAGWEVGSELPGMAVEAATMGLGGAGKMIKPLAGLGLPAVKEMAKAGGKAMLGGMVTEPLEETLSNVMQQPMEVAHGMRPGERPLDWRQPGDVLTSAQEVTVPTLQGMIPNFLMMGGVGAHQAYRQGRANYEMATNPAITPEQLAANRAAGRPAMPGRLGTAAGAETAPIVHTVPTVPNAPIVPPVMGPGGVMPLGTVGTTPPVPTLGAGEIGAVAPVAPSKPKPAMAGAGAGEPPMMEPSMRPASLETLRGLAGSKANYQRWSNVGDGSDAAAFYQMVEAPFHALMQAREQGVPITRADIDDLLATNKVYQGKRTLKRAGDVLETAFVTADAAPMTEAGAVVDPLTGETFTLGPDPVMQPAVPAFDPETGEILTGEPAPLAGLGGSYEIDNEAQAVAGVGPGALGGAGVAPAAGDYGAAGVIAGGDGVVGGGERVDRGGAGGAPTLYSDVAGLGTGLATDGMLGGGAGASAGQFDAGGSGAEPVLGGGEDSPVAVDGLGTLSGGQNVDESQSVSGPGGVPAGLGQGYAPEGAGEKPKEGGRGQEEGLKAPAAPSWGADGPTLPGVNGPATRAELPGNRFEPVLGQRRGGGDNEASTPVIPKDRAAAEPGTGAPLGGQDAVQGETGKAAGANEPSLGVVPDTELEEFLHGGLPEGVTRGRLKQMLEDENLTQGANVYVKGGSDADTLRDLGLVLPSQHKNYRGWFTTDGLTIKGSDLLRYLSRQTKVENSQMPTPEPAAGGLRVTELPNNRFRVEVADVAAAQKALIAAKAPRGTVNAGGLEFNSQVRDKVLGILGGPVADTETLKPGQVAATDKAEYRYALVNRPAGYSQVPDGYVRVDSRPAKGEDHHEMSRHGIVVYPRQLSADEVRSFELAPILEGEDRQGFAEKIANSYDDDDAAYLLNIHADEPDIVREQIASDYERLGKDYGRTPSVGNFDSFIDSVLAALGNRGNSKAHGPTHAAASVPPSAVTSKPAAEQVPNKADVGQKEPEDVVDKRLHPPIFDYFVKVTASNSADIKPLPGKLFTPEQTQQLAEWLGDLGLNVQVPDTERERGRVIRVYQKTGGINVNGIVSGKNARHWQTQEKIARELREKDEKELEQARQTLEQSPARDWIAAQFGDVGTHFAAGLSRVLDGTAKTVDNVLPPREADEPLRRMGMEYPLPKDWAQRVKQRYERDRQQAAKPLDNAGVTNEKAPRPDEKPAFEKPAFEILNDRRKQRLRRSVEREAWDAAAALPELLEGLGSFETWAERAQAVVGGWFEAEAKRLRRGDPDRAAMVRALVVEGRPVLPKDFYESLHQEAVKRKKAADLEAARDPAVYETALAAAFPANLSPMFLNDFKGGWDHALAGKTASTMPAQWGGPKEPAHLGFKAAEAWIKTAEGQAWFTGTPRAKLENTGAALRRWFDQAKQALEGVSVSDAELAWREVEAATTRAEFFREVLSAEATPGALRYLDRVRQEVLPFKEWFAAQAEWWRWPSGISDGEKILAWLQKGGRVESGKFRAAESSEQRIEVLKEAALKYTESVNDLVALVRGAATVQEVGEQFTRALLTPASYGALAKIVAEHSYWTPGRYSHLELTPPAEALEQAKLLRRGLYRLLAWQHTDLLKNEAESNASNKKKPLTPPRLEAVTRQGEDWRNGQNVTPETVKTDLGLVNVGFGKWVSTKADQNHLDYAYDAFSDLAKLIGVDRRAVGLGDWLWFTIGALGHGKFAAHFAPAQPHPDGGTVPVINVTNTRGDGTVAHEWIHALDHWAQQAKMGEGRDLLGAIQEIQRELKRAYDYDRVYRGVLEHLKGERYFRGNKNDRMGNAETAVDYYARNQVSQFKQDADKLGKDYWGSEAEMLARAGEAAVLDLLEQAGQVNTYLVNPDWVGEGRVTGATHRGTPYPVGEERTRFTQYFKALFGALRFKDGALGFDQGAWLQARPTQAAEFAAALTELKRRIPEIARQIEAEQNAKTKAAEEAAIARKEAERLAEQARIREELERQRAETPAPVETSGPLSEAELNALFDEALAELQEETQERPEVPEPGAALQPDPDAKAAASSPLTPGPSPRGEGKAADYGARWDAMSFDDRERVAKAASSHPKVVLRLYRSQWAEIWSEGERADLIDAMKAEDAKAAKGGTTTPTTAPEPAVETAAGLVAKAAELGVKGVDEAFKGLFELFGGNSLRSFPGGIDEATYAKAKPHFEASLRAFQEAGQTLKDLFKFLIQHFGAGIKPYAVRFAQEQGLGVNLSVAKTATATDTLARWVRGRLQAADEPIAWRELFKQADAAFGGTQAAGVYTPKDAYDAMESGVNQFILQHSEWSPAGSRAEAAETIKALQALLTFVPTQTQRTQEQEEFQQFSTPPTLAYAANWAANVQDGEAMLEPSAGIGGLAVFSQLAGARVTVNELSQRRAAVLREVLPTAAVFTENAEQLHNILPESVRPTVIVMNPPFSATAGRVTGQRSTLNGARHIEQALARLAPGGRLVAIVGEGMADDRPAFRAWWKTIKGQYAVRANVGVSGEEYRKYGTTFDNQLLVIDKVAPVSAPVVTGKVSRVEDLLEKLEGIRDLRQKPLAGDTRGEPLAAEPGGAKVPEGAGPGNSARSESATAGGRGRDDGEVSADGPGLSGLGVAGPAGGRDDTGVQTPGSDGDTGGVRGGKRGARPGQGGGKRRVSAGGRADSVAAGDESGGVPGSGLTIEGESKNAKAGGLSAALYENYVPTWLKIPGAVAHPTKLVESAPMAAVDAPKPTYTPNLPKATITEGKLSLAQLEAVVYAGMAHEKRLPNGTRRGFMIGDGTGVGKGREIAGVLLDNWRQGRKKAVWLSVSTDLYRDSRSYWEAVGGPAGVFHEAPKDYGPIQQAEGVLFVSYNWLVGQSKPKQGQTGEPKTRLQQLLDWLGPDFDGVIAYDEAHKMGNAGTMGANNVVRGASKTALVGIELQRQLPEGRFLYATGTAATEVRNFQYAERLGLWGDRTAFADRNAFTAAIQAGGPTAMELVAQGLKAQGSYLARSLSYDGVTQEILEHPISDDQREIYDHLAQLWQELWRQIGVAGEKAGEGKKKSRSNRASQFWGAQQRFFESVMTSLNMPTIIERARQDLAEGHAVIFQLTKTGQANQDREEERVKQQGLEIEDMDLSPKQNLINLVRDLFPVTQFEEYLDADGNVQTRPVFDAQGNPVVNRECLEMREELIRNIEGLRAVDNPLDMIMEAFGHEQVAEITGRSRRFVWERTRDGGLKRVMQKRGDSSNAADMDAFMDGKKPVLVFSEAGGTGFSFHADNTRANRKRRMHYLVQAGWRAVTAIQGLGRSHRTNEASQPHYRLVSNNLKAYKRFISSVARRIEQLGALTRGERKTGGQGLFSAEDNLENQYAAAGLHELIQEMFDHDRARFDSVIDGMMGFSGLVDERAGTLIRGNVNNVKTTQWMNRMLNLTMAEQNQLFDEWLTRIDELIQKDIEAGTYDGGIRTIQAAGIEKSRDEVIYVDPETGAEAHYLELRLTQPYGVTPWEKAAQVHQEHKRKRIEKAGFFRDEKSGEVVLLVRRDSTKTLDSGQVVHRGVVYAPIWKQWDGSYRYIENADAIFEGTPTTKKPMPWPVYKGQFRYEPYTHPTLGARDVFTTHLEAALKREGREGVQAWLESRTNAAEKAALEKLWAGMQAEIVEESVERSVPRFTPLSVEDARAAWDQYLASAPKTYEEYTNLVAGVILPVWDRIPGSPKVTRALLTDGQRVIGREVSGPDMPALRKNFGIGSNVQQLPAAAVWDRIMTRGAAGELANGWRLKRADVGGDKRLEVVASSFSSGETKLFESWGLFSQKIGWTYRWFVPNQEALGALLATKPLAELSGGEEAGAAQFSRGGARGPVANAHTPETLTGALNRALAPFGPRLGTELVKAGAVRLVSGQEAAQVVGGRLYSLAAPPQKTGVAYRALRLVNGHLYPAMVGDRPIPFDAWLEAEYGPPNAYSRGGTKYPVKDFADIPEDAENLWVKSAEGGEFAFRPGYHAGDVPSAKQFVKKNGQWPQNLVWVEVEYNATNDYDQHPMFQGKKGLALKKNMLRSLPDNGFFKYRTNPDPSSMAWVISDKARHVRVMADDEVRALVDKYNRTRSETAEPAFFFEREGGSITAEDAARLNAEISQNYSSEVLRKRRKGSVHETTAAARVPGLGADMVGGEIILRPGTEIRYSEDGRPLAFFNPADGIVYLIHDHLPQSMSPKALRGLMLHELGVHALQLGQSDAEFQAILAEVEGLSDDRAAKAGRRVPKGTPAGLRAEETLAYLLEDHPDLPIVKRFIAWLRAKVRALMQRFNVRMALGTDDLIYMGREALRTWARERRAAQAGSGDVRFFRAWHGGGDFDRFDASFIGSGAQTRGYGHGFYFSDVQAIGEFYRKLIESMGKPAHLYEVELAPKADEWLDYFKDVGEQSIPVQAGLKALGFADPAQTGEDVYAALAQREGGPPQASRALREAGVKGIRYPAEGRQNRGKSNYVLFDPRDAEVVNKFSFAGAGAESADLHALGTAKGRLEAGENAETVRQETGWFQGRDGKWRFEIDDSQAVLKFDPRQWKGQTWGEVYQSLLDAKGGEEADIYLGDVLHHPALFAAYPNLRYMTIGADPQGNNAAMYYPERDSIGMRPDLSRYDIKSPLLHELQHAIQQREGFAKGGAAGLFMGRDAQFQQLLQTKNHLAKRYQEAKLTGRDPYGTDKTLAELKADAEQAIRAFDEYRRLLKQAGPDAYESYRRLGGEVEARNVQARMGMSADERRAVSPRRMQAEDVADDEVIIVWNGKEMASAPRPENANEWGPLPAGVVDFSQDARFHELFYAEPTAAAVKAFGQWLKDNPETVVRLYHGSAAINPIGEQGILKTTARRRNSLQSASGYTYLSVYPGMAGTFANFAAANRAADADGFKRRVYAVDLRVAELLPDKDQLRNQRTFGGREVGNSLAESLVFGHAARVKGDIHPGRIQDSIRFSRQAAEGGDVWAEIDAGTRAVPTWQAAGAGAEKNWNQLGGWARRQWLGALTVQQLVEQGSDLLPRMQEYLRHMTGMDVTRNTVLHEVDGIAKAWESLDRTWTNRLAHVMHESTLAGVDGAGRYVLVNAQGKESLETYSTRAEAEEAAARRGGLTVATQAEVTFKPLVDPAEAEARMKTLRRLQAGSGKDSAKIMQWQAEIKELEAKLAFDAQREREFPRIVALYQALSPEAKAVYLQARDYHVEQSLRVEAALLAHIEHSTMSGAAKGAAMAKLRAEFEAQRVQAPYFPLGRDGDYWVSVQGPDGENEFVMFDTLEEQQAAMSDYRAQGLTIAARGTQTENLREVVGVSSTFVAQVESLIAELGVSVPEVAELRDAVYQLYLRTLPELSARKHFIHRKKTPGFGQDALLTFAKKGYHDAYQYARLKHGYELRQAMEDVLADVKTAASKSMQAGVKEELRLIRAFRAEVLDANLTLQEVRERADSHSLRWQERLTVARMTRRSPTPAEREEEALAERWAQYRTWLENWGRYGGGARAFAERRTASLEQRLSSGRAINQADRGYERASHFYDELQQAYQHLMSPSTGTWANTVNQVGYLWHLAFSPAAWITNATQTPLITMPYVAAKHGMKATTGAFQQAYREAMRGATSGKKDHALGIREALTDPKEIEAYEAALERGLIDRGRAMDLAGLAEEGAGRSGWHRKFAMAMTFGFHDAERLNREVSFMASYRLAKAGGASEAAAIEYGAKVVNDTHFNYTAENRPRFLRSDLLRVLGQFKLYSQHVTYLQWRAMRQALGTGATKEETREARRFLLFQTGVQLAAGGVLGLPLWVWATGAAVQGGLAATARWGWKGALGYAATLIGAAVALTGDDDDDPKAWEAEFQQTMKEWFGPTGGRVASRGLVNALGGVDLSTRIGMADLWWREPNADAGDRALWGEILGQATGAGIGTAAQWVQGLQMAADGHVWRGVETMLPKVTKDAMQAFRLASEGAKSLKGDTLVDDFSPWELTAKAEGFQPDVLAARYAENRAEKDRQATITERRSRILGEIAEGRIDYSKAREALETGDMAKAQDRVRAAMAELKAFNAKNPGFKIDHESIMASIKARRKARALAKDGVFLNRKIGERYDFAG